MRRAKRVQSGVRIANKRAKGHSEDMEENKDDQNMVCRASPSGLTPILVGAT